MQICQDIFAQPAMGKLQENIAFALLVEKNYLKQQKRQEYNSGNCLKCGAYLPLNAKFCSECGANQYIGEAFEYELPDYGNCILNSNKCIFKGLKDKSLKNVALPNYFTEIVEKAFNGCSKLTSVEIPASAIEIGDKAFKGCDCLEDVSIEGLNFSESDIKRVFGESFNFRQIKIRDKIVHVRSLRHYYDQENSL